MTLVQILVLSLYLLGIWKFAMRVNQEIRPYNVEDKDYIVGKMEWLMIFALAMFWPVYVVIGMFESDEDLEEERAD